MSRNSLKISIAYENCNRQHKNVKKNILCPSHCTIRYICDNNNKVKRSGGTQFLQPSSPSESAKVKFIHANLSPYATSYLIAKKIVMLALSVTILEIFPVEMCKDLIVTFEMGYGQM